MHWIFLILAGLLEIAFTTCMKKSENFSNLWWSVGFFASIICSFYLLNRAVQTIPLGTAYGIWSGIGAVGTVIVGILVFNEPATFWRMFFIFLLIAAIVGLKLSTAE